MSKPLTTAELGRLDAWWRAANYLSVGQIYLLDNPLLREPLQLEPVKPRLLGHWGTSPGSSFVYVHANLAIRAHDLDVIYVIGPGHGGSAIVANAFLEGAFSEVYPEVSQDADGMRRLFRQLSFPAASRVTWRPRRPTRSTRAASGPSRGARARWQPSRTGWLVRTRRCREVDPWCVPESLGASHSSSRSAAAGFDPALCPTT